MLKYKIPQIVTLTPYKSPNLAMNKKERRRTCLPVHRNCGIAKRLIKNEREETIPPRHFDMLMQ